jgi:hypothetical protein
MDNVFENDNGDDNIANVFEHNNDNNDIAPTWANGVICTALIKVTALENGGDEVSPACEFPGGEIVSISFDQGSDYWKQKMDSGEFKSGQTQVSCDSVESLPGRSATCFIRAGQDTRFLSNVVDTYNLEKNGRRKLAVVEGTKTILVVRVIANTARTTSEETALADDVFDDAFNVAKQYTACSFGKLNFIKADDLDLVIGTTDETNISNGVTTVVIDASGTEDPSILEAAVTTALKENFSVSSPSVLADHVMYMLPPGGPSFTAYAYLNSWNSVYSDSSSNWASVHLHEIGHNLNLAHSNEIDEYEDRTGLVSDGGTI